MPPRVQTSRYCGIEQWQLGWFIPNRSGVRVLLPLQIMANYIDKSYFQTEYGEQLFIRLFSFKSLPTDPEPVEVDAEAKFDAIVASVSAEIDGYLRRRHTLPLATVPQDLKDRALRMVRYYGELKSPAPLLSEKVRNDYRDIVKWLEQLAAGRVDLGIAAPPTENSDRSVEITSNERVLTETRLKSIL